MKNVKKVMSEWKRYIDGWIDDKSDSVENFYKELESAIAKDDGEVCSLKKQVESLQRAEKGWADKHTRKCIELELRLRNEFAKSNLETPTELTREQCKKDLDIKDKAIETLGIQNSLMANCNNCKYTCPECEKIVGECSGAKWEFDEKKARDMK